MCQDKWNLGAISKVHNTIGIIFYENGSFLDPSSSSPVLFLAPLSPPLRQRRGAFSPARYMYAHPPPMWPPWDVGMQDSSYGTTERCAERGGGCCIPYLFPSPSKSSTSISLVFWSRISEVVLRVAQPWAIQYLSQLSKKSTGRLWSEFTYITYVWGPDSPMFLDGFSRYGAHFKAYCLNFNLPTFC